MDGAGGQVAAAERRVAWEARGGCASVSRMGEAEPAAGPTGVDEAALVAGLKARRPESFETLVRTYTPRLLAVAMRMLGSTEDAQDVVQDAMLSAYRAIDRFEGNARVSTLLLRIVVHAALVEL